MIIRRMSWNKLLWVEWQTSSWVSPPHSLGVNWEIPSSTVQSGIPERFLIFSRLDCTCSKHLVLWIPAVLPSILVYFSVAMIKHHDLINLRVNLSIQFWRGKRTQGQEYRAASSLCGGRAGNRGIALLTANVRQREHGMRLLVSKPTHNDVLVFARASAPKPLQTAPKSRNQVFKCLRLSGTLYSSHHTRNAFYTGHMLNPTDTQGSKH